MPLPPYLTHRATPEGGSQPPSEWAQQIRFRLQEGDCFRAYDAAIDALEAHPDNAELRLLYTHAMLRTGALEQAREVLLSWKQEILPTLLQQADSTAWAASQLMQLGELFLECWQREGQRSDLHHARELLLAAYDLDEHCYRAGITGATLSHLAGDPATAQQLATKILHASQQTTQQDFHRHFSDALAHLLHNDEAAAMASLAAATHRVGEHYSLVVSARQELLRYRLAGLSMSDAVLDILSPPSLVLFAGTPLDRPGLMTERFPAYLEPAVYQAITEHLERLHARIGYSSAACGSDILFCEAMLDRHGEINLVLPFAQEDFRHHRVRHPTGDWENRFQRILEAAHSVHYATEERYLGHDILFRYANQILMGHAMMRASFLSSEPYLLAVWDLMLKGEQGTASDFIDHWPDILRLRLIDLDELRSTSNTPSATVDTPPPTPARYRLNQARAVLPRAIKAMLFADVVGYTRLAEEHLPGFHALLSELVVRLRGRHPPLEKIESWGDAIFAVLPNAISMAEYALLLQQTATDLDPAEFALPSPVQFRVGLHAGPVFQGRDPLTGRPNVYGHHVNHAARIEPVAAPGQVYASEQFVALLQAEENAARHAAESTGQPYTTRFAFDYLGILPLAKRYGTRPVYHLKLQYGVRL